MQIIKREYTVYTFAELSDQAKEKALTEMWDINVDYEWWDGVYIDSENIGLKITGFDIGRSWEIDVEYMENFEDIMSNILKDHGEKCATYDTARRYFKEIERVNNKSDWSADKIDVAEDNITRSFQHELKHDYLNILKREYEYLTSEESIIESIEANEIKFLVDGEVFS